MWKLVGAVLVAAGSGWLGLSAAAGLTKRLRAVQSMIVGLELMERELWERGAALPELAPSRVLHTPNFYLKNWKLSTNFIF